MQGKKRKESNGDLEKRINKNFESMLPLPSMKEHPMATLMPHLHGPKGADWTTVQQHMRDVHKSLWLDLTEAKRPLAVELKRGAKPLEGKKHKASEFSLDAIQQCCTQNLTADAIHRRPEQKQIYEHLLSVLPKLPRPSGFTSLADVGKEEEDFLRALVAEGVRMQLEAPMQIGGCDPGHPFPEDTLRYILKALILEVGSLRRKAGRCDKPMGWLEGGSKTPRPNGGTPGVGAGMPKSLGKPFTYPPRHFTRECQNCVWQGKSGQMHRHSDCVPTYQAKWIVPCRRCIFRKGYIPRSVNGVAVYDNEFLHVEGSTDLCKKSY